MFSLSELEDAQQQIYGAFPATPQREWPLLTARIGAETWVKHENHTPTGAFKVRGGLIHLARLAAQGLAPNGVISQSTGNHGQSLAYAGRRIGMPVTMVVRRGNSTEKNAAMRAFGARLIEHGADFEASKEEASRLAKAEGLFPIASFHPDLVLGVATWALEFFRGASPLDVLYVPIGLGSSICGAIRTRDLLGLKTEIVGVQSAGAPPYALSFAAGHVVQVNRAETNADGVAVRVPDPEAFEIIRKGAARVVTVTDDEIAAAIRVYWTDTHNLAEGAAATPLAAAIKEREILAGRRVGLVLSGGNIDLALFRKWVLGDAHAHSE